MVKKPIDERPLTQKLHSTHFLHKFKKIYQNFVFPKHKYGWPGTSLVGLDGCRAAWVIAQNAISLPEFQRQCLLLLKVAAEHGEASSRQVAFLTDRILFNERKPQMYGVIGDWAGSRYFCESLFWASQPKQAAKT